MKIRVLAIVFGFISMFTASQAFAAKGYAETFSYFDEAGNVIGQSIDTCNSAREASGVTSIYWREDVTLCTTDWTILGEMCLPSTDNGGWVCIPNQFATQVGGERVKRDFLPLRPRGP